MKPISLEELGRIARCCVPFGGGTDKEVGQALLDQFAARGMKQVAIRNATGLSCGIRRGGKEAIILHDLSALFPADGDYLIIPVEKKDES